MAGSASMAGKVALITGAASGLGRATALAFAEAGATVFLVDRDADGLAQTAALMESNHPIHPADLADPAACAGAVTAAVAQLGRLDALCNVAGLIHVANSHEMPLAQWNQTIAVNLTAPFLLSQAAIPHLLASDGAIINVASTAAHIGQAYTAAYCASKAGLVHLTRSMAMEYTHKPIRINAISPGGMMTNIAANFGPPEGAEVALMKRYSGMRGLVEVDDVAAMILLLASDAGRGFHGSCINMDAGITAG